MSTLKNSEVAPKPDPTSNSPMSPAPHPAHTQDSSSSAITRSVIIKTEIKRQPLMTTESITKKQSSAQEEGVIYSSPRSRKGITVSMFTPQKRPESGQSNIVSSIKTNRNQDSGQQFNYSKSQIKTPEHLNLKQVLNLSSILKRSHNFNQEFESPNKDKTIQPGNRMKETVTHNLQLNLSTVKKELAQIQEKSEEYQNSFSRNGGVVDTYYQKEIQTLKAIIEDLKRDKRLKIEQLEQENQILRKNYDKIRVTYAQMSKSIEKRQHYSEEYMALVKECEELRSTIKSQALTLQTLNIERNTQLMESQKIKSQVLSQKRVIEQNSILQNQNSKLRETLKASQRKYSELIEAHNSEIKRFQEKFLELHTRYIQLQKNSLESKQMQTELQQVKQINKMLTRQNQQLNKSIRQLQTDIQTHLEARQESQRVEESRRTMTNQINNLQIEVEKAYSLLRTKQHELDESSNQLKIKQTELETTLAELGSVRAILVEMNKKPAKTVVETNSNELQVLRRQQTEISEIRRREQYQYGVLVAENQQLRKSLVDLKTVVVKLSTEVKSMNGMSEMWNSQRSQMTVHVQMLKGLIDEYVRARKQQDQASSTAQMMRSSQEIRLLQSRIKKQVQQVEGVDELEKAKSQFNGFISRLQLMSQKLEAQSRNSHKITEVHTVTTRYNQRSAT